MSRQARITEGLRALESHGAIQAFKRETDPAEPTRVRWHVQVNDIRSLYLKTNEAEILLDGAGLMHAVTCV